MLATRRQHTDCDREACCVMRERTRAQVQKKDNPESSDEELNQAFADHDTDGSGHLTMEEWNQPFDEAVSEMMHTSSEHAASEDEMMRQHQMEFEGYDKNSDGMLDVDEVPSKP
jgi:hypothetical protein